MKVSCPAQGKGGKWFLLLGTWLVTWLTAAAFAHHLSFMTGIIKSLEGHQSLLRSWVERCEGSVIEHVKSTLSRIRGKISQHRYSVAAWRFLGKSGKNLQVINMTVYQYVGASSRLMLLIVSELSEYLQCIHNDNQTSSHPHTHTVSLGLSCKSEDPGYIF